MAASRFRHPLAVVRARAGHSLAGYVNAVADRHAALGYGQMARRREKVARWEAGVEPERTAQLAMADLHGVAPQEVLGRGWPDWLMLALPGPDPAAPFTEEAALGALDDLAADPERAQGPDGPLLPEPVLLALAERWTAHVQASITRGETGGYVGGEVTTAIHARLTALWHLDDSLGGAACTAGARSDLRMVARLLRHARHTGPVTADLLHLAAEYARFLGWAQFDAGNTGGAQRAWHAALRASAQTVDPVHGAYLLANLALQQVYDGRPRTGLELLGSAKDLAGRKAPPVVQAMIDAWQVRAAAAAGDGRAAAQFLRCAETSYDRAEGGESPAWAYWMCRPTHLAETGRAFLDLDDPGTAEVLLGEGLAALGDAAVRDRVLYLVWIATARARRGELEAAASTAAEAWQTSREVESSRCTALLRDLTAELAPHRGNRVIDEALELLAC